AVPQALSVHNAYQAYPWSLARHHPGWRVRVAALRWFFRRSLRCADAVIVQTGMMREYVRAIEGCPDCVAVLPKAVLSSPDDPGESISPRLASLLDKDSGLFTALYVAGDTPHKNHSLLASIMRICSERAIPVRLVVTLNSEEWSRAGGPSAKHLTGSGRVIPAGWIPKGQLRDLYTRVDWCVMPSLLESLSSSHLEAMQWGRPQVAADLPYARDLCGDAAVYADVRDPYSWVACLERLRSEPDLGTRLVAHGFARLKAFPATWTDMAERIRAIFLDVVKPVRPEERSDEEHVNAFR
ncbi:MAG: glycosyltransferase, partial [Acidobacteria bacterium]|nr:glycosyltransferase [Acidobacteriota bacterium]